jgi:hypothetical protein
MKSLGLVLDMIHFIEVDERAGPYMWTEMTKNVRCRRVRVRVHDHDQHIMIGNDIGNDVARQDLLKPALEEPNPGVG